MYSVIVVSQKFEFLISKIGQFELPTEMTQISYQNGLKMEFNDLQKIICLRKSEVSA